MSRGRQRSEEDLIHRIRRIFPAPGRRVPVPIGDDAAVLRISPSHRLVVTTDQLVEGVHFRRQTHPPALLGEKALAVNLSDLSAMGSSPRWALLSLFLPPDLSPRYLEAVLHGMARSARRNGVVLIGGNITASKVMVLDVTLLGAMAPGVRPLLRRGARVGDTLYVSGPLGGAALGLSLLRAGWRWRKRPPRKLHRPPLPLRQVAGVLRKHLSPEPELGLGALLARHRLATAAMDLSDGLALDLHRLCRASGVGARLLSTALPLDPAAQSWVGEKEARRLALHGGEDYRLLFAIPPSREKRLRRMVPSERLRPIGRLVSRREGIKLEDPEGRIEPLAPLGYDHLLDGRRAIRTHRH